jgi:hypothetical protein
MRYTTKMVEVDIELNDFNDEDIISYLQDRDYMIGKSTLLTDVQESAIYDLYQDYVEGKDLNKSVKKVLDELYKYVPLRSV